MAQIQMNEVDKSKSDVKLDLLIPVIEKDLDVLPFVIDAARENVKHPIKQILIVAPDSTKIKNVCTQKGCRFIDENLVLPIQKKDIDYKTKEWDRSGWLFQQLLKLCGDSLCSQEHYLVIDADTLFIRPHVFISHGKNVFYCRDTKFKGYLYTYHRLLGVKAAAPLSFVTHYMMFQASKVRALKAQIEHKNKTDWYTAILQSINKTRELTFSEFETYGNYFYSHFPDQVKMLQALNLSLKRSELKTMSKPKLLELAKHYRSVSFHSYNN